MAMAINKVIVIGNLGSNPVIRALPNSGRNVANFSVATTERFTDRNGAKQERTDWHRIVAFGRAGGYVRAVPDQGPASLRRRAACNPPIRSEGRKRQALPDRNRSAATPPARQSRQHAQDRNVRRHPLLVSAHTHGRAAKAVLPPYHSDNRRLRKWTSTRS